MRRLPVTAAGRPPHAAPSSMAAVVAPYAPGRARRLGRGGGLGRCRGGRRRLHHDLLSHAREPYPATAAGRQLVESEAALVGGVPLRCLPWRRRGGEDPARRRLGFEEGDWGWDGRRGKGGTGLCLLPTLPLSPMDKEPWPAMSEGSYPATKPRSPRAYGSGGGGQK